MEALETTTDSRDELEKLESRLNSLFRASPLGIGVIREHVFLEVNDRLCGMTGHEKEELLGQNPRMLYSSEADFDHVGRELYTHHARPAGSVETRWRRKDGSDFDVLLHASLLDPATPAAGMTFMAMDVTERKKLENQLREQAAILGQSQDAILVMSLDRRLTYCNRNAERLYGRGGHEMLGQAADAFLFPDTPRHCSEICQTTLDHGAWSGEIHTSTNWGKRLSLYSRWTLICNAEGLPESILIANTDITEKKRLEEQFLRSQRMESIGTLASGVAHDLNNILTPILMSIELLRAANPQPDDEVLLSMLNDGAQRGASIVKQLLTFGRGLEGQRAELQLRSLLKEMAKIVQETFPKSIVVEQEFPKDLWVVNADPTQVHQVLLNLCVNARDAMPNGGKLTLSAENLMLDEDYAAINPEAKPGPYVVLQVGDTGTGIPSELLDKIFDPFFSTKEPGKGTGLGLSTVLGIAKSHEGFVQVASRVGEGTHFKVYLPAKIGQDAPRSKAQPPRLPQGRGQMILVVDDEESIRNVARRMLEKNGYRVLVAKDGAEGLITYSQRRQEIQLVITDMIMPVMDGAALIRALRGYSPDLHTIAMSGLATQQEEASKPGFKTNGFMHKPFTAEQILVTLHDVFSAGSSGNSN